MHVIFHTGLVSPIYGMTVCIHSGLVWYELCYSLCGGMIMK